MKRRALLPLAGLALQVPMVGAQQAGRTYRIGWLSATSRAEPYAVAMVQRLAELGFVEGRNLAIEFRSGPSGLENNLALATELSRLNCDLYFAPGNSIGLQAVKQSTRDKPIVTVANDFDPVQAGFVDSLARPGGRITGISQLMGELPAKRLEVARELLPRLRRVAVISDASSQAQLLPSRTAAGRLGLELLVHEFTASPYDYAAAFRRFVAARAEVFVPLGSAFFAADRQTVIDLAARHRLPAVFLNTVWPEAGGLLSYGPNFTASYRRAAEMAAKLLTGANPALMPIEQPSVVEMVLNLKTARALGVVVPRSIMLRADRVMD